MKLLSGTKEKKIRSLGLLIFCQFLLLLCIPVQAEAGKYAEEDRYYTMQYKMTENVDGYTKMTIDPDKKQLVVDTCRINCKAVGIQYRKGISGEEKKLDVVGKVDGNNYTFEIPLDSWEDGDYIIIVWYVHNGSNYYNFYSGLHMVIEDGEPFFPKDTAYKMGEKQLNVLKKVNEQSMLSDTSYLGSSEAEMKAKADSIVAGCTNDYQKCEALYQWVLDHVTYTFNTENEAVDVFKTGKGVCFGYANLFTAMLRLEGIPAATITGGTYMYDYFDKELDDYYAGGGYEPSCVDSLLF